MNHPQDVSRLISYLQDTVQDVLTQHLFEPHDEVTRHSVTSMIESFLADLQQKRCLLDYQVICSDENNPPSCINQGTLIVDVLIKPVFPTEDIHQIHASIGNQPILEEETMAMMGSYNTSQSNMPSTPMPALISLRADGFGNSTLSFSGEENNLIVLAEFTPERNISTYEYMHIMQLQLLLISSALTGQDPRGLVNPIEIIRRHNLERHFKFSEY